MLVIFYALWPVKALTAFFAGPLLCVKYFQVILQDRIKWNIAMSTSLSQYSLVRAGLLRISYIAFTKMVNTTWICLDQDQPVIHCNILVLYFSKYILYLLFSCLLVKNQILWSILPISISKTTNIASSANCILWQFMFVAKSFACIIKRISPRILPWAIPVFISARVLCSV